MPGYVDPGIGTERSSKAFQDFFARWGAKANLRSVWNTVVPVTIVDRFRGEDEGSLYALTGYTPGAANEHPAIFMGAAQGATTRDDTALEILGWYGGFAVTASVAIINPVLNIFSPEYPYNPVLNQKPVGVFIAGLFTNRSFTRGEAIAFGGSNPAWPVYAGAMGLNLGSRLMAMTGGQLWSL